jgi:oligopeptide/dipeptide ABC transporter ATP-binding protein
VNNEAAPPLIKAEALSRRFAQKSPSPWQQWKTRLKSRASAAGGGGGPAPALGSWLHAVDDVSFEIRRGESVGLVGESGCGKSTLARLLTHLLPPSAGRILFDGRDLGALHASGDPQRFAIQQVFQDPSDSLNPRWSAADAIADPLRRIQRLRFPHQLSGGQKARVGIARAIAISPSLLVLDEPTSALDVSVQAVILQLLDDLRRRLGMTYLFVTHDLSVVKLLCDRVIVMYLGRIVESGPVETVFARPAHPYTQGLLSAIPSFDPAAAPARTRLDGEPRSPIDPDPNVCCLDGRCPSATQRCREERPLLRSLASSDHQAACHHADAAD